MKRKITFVSLFIVFLLIATPITQAIGQNNTQKVKNDLYKILSDTKADDNIKDSIIENLEKIDKIDESTLKFIIKFKNLLEKSDIITYNFWLQMALIHFLWAIYYMIEGNQALARLQLQLALLDLIFYVMVYS